MTIRLLLADDDTDFLDVTAYALRRAGFDVSVAMNGAQALENWRDDDYDIVMLDVNMPKKTGVEVCQEIRQVSPIPVVLMSGNKRESEIVIGFEAGADDYVTKPFNVRHVTMLLRAIHRRNTGHPHDLIPRHITIPPLIIDLDSYSLLVESEPVFLTRLEFRLFYCLAANCGRVVTTERLVDFAWGMDGEGDTSLLKTHFSHIRRKLAEVTDMPLAIRAFPGAGYSLQVPAHNSATLA